MDAFGYRDLIGLLFIVLVITSAGCSTTMTSQRDVITSIVLYNSEDSPKTVRLEIADSSTKLYDQNVTVNASTGEPGDSSTRIISPEPLEGVRFEITATVDGSSETVVLNEDTSYEILVRVGRGISIQKGLETTP